MSRLSVEVVKTCVGTCITIGPLPDPSGTGKGNSACIYADNVNERDYGHHKIGDELLATAHLFASAPETAAELTRVRNVNAELVHWLTLMSTAKERGFGIDYVTAAAKSAIDIVRVQG